MPRLLLILALFFAGCTDATADDDDSSADDDDDTVDDDDDSVDDDDTAGDDDDDTQTPRLPAEWAADCAGIRQEDSGYGGVVATWTAQDRAWPHPAGGTVLAGSSSIRRWETAWATLGRLEPIQRGFGGAQLWEFAAFADELILSHQPARAVVFAGTNDLAFGRSVEETLGAYRCLASRLDALAVPLWFIGITPTPSRWSGWTDAAALNEAVAGWAEAYPEALHYIDIPTPFLATGAPPESGLFVDDQLHLSERGYAIWSETIAAALAGEADAPAGAATPLAPGVPLLIDLGPSNAEDGLVADIDDQGRIWNPWHPLEGEVMVLAGERLGPMRASDGSATSIGLVVSGGFRSNGLLNGGWPAPDSRIGDLAVPEATADYFYLTGPDVPGALTLTGLTPGARYRLRLFASRDWGDERRVTRYTVEGAGPAQQQSLQTSGPGASADGAVANRDTVIEFSAVEPDARGQLRLDLAIEEGSYGYLSLLELTRN